MGWIGGLLLPLDWMELPLCVSGTRPQPQLKGLSDSQEGGCKYKPATLLHEQTTTTEITTYAVKMAAFTNAWIVIQSMSDGYALAV